MGQMEPTQDGIDFLINILENDNEQVVVRHEAAEALGNF
jgi:hypothetical protein